MMEPKKEEKIPNAQRIECAEIIPKMEGDITANDIKYDKKITFENILINFVRSRAINSRERG